MISDSVAKWLTTDHKKRHPLKSGCLVCLMIILYLDNFYIYRI